ncbi:MAG: class I SAM-dependent methyltransferase [Planctomycetota bacterium]|jgi:2-polyprenyl-3-methyl-5-hydroxy-6-metoxy-1,4-benzoquinol methylase
MNDKISSEKTIENPVYERRWEYAIKSGKIQLGNLQTNLAFLEQTGLVDNGKTALELGCGSGQLASFFYKKGVSIIASDISETAIDHARKLYPDVMFQTHSAEELPYEDGSFDIVMSFDVLEHLPNVDQHLREVRRVLKPDGYYLFQTPNKLSNAIFETLKCRSMAWKKYHPSLHYYGQLKHRLKRNRFRPKCVKMDTMNEFAIKKIKKIGLPGWLLAWINFRYMPFRLQTNFYVIAQKNDSE